MSTAPDITNLFVVYLPAQFERDDLTHLARCSVPHTCPGGTGEVHFAIWAEEKRANGKINLAVLRNAKFISRFRLFLRKSDMNVALREPN